MKQIPTWGYAVGFVIFGIVVILIVNVIQVAMKPDPTEQMHAAVLEMREASLKGQAGGVLEHMSRSFRLPAPYDEAASNQLAEFSRWIRQAQIERLEITDLRPEVRGETGIVTAHVNAAVGSPFPFSFNGPVEIRFRKEVHRRLFVIPEEKWLVESFGDIDMANLNFGM